MAQRPEDFNLPNTAISKILNEALPKGVEVSDGAKLALSKAASVFVLYAASCANNVASSNNKKTLKSEDVLEAIDELGFGALAEELSYCLAEFNNEKLKKIGDKKKKNQKDESQDEDEQEDQDDQEIEDQDDDQEVEDQEVQEETEAVVLDDDDDVVVIEDVQEEDDNDNIDEEENINEGSVHDDETLNDSENEVIILDDSSNISSD